ncbi:MAG: hypothetical protein EA353_14320 [Puniceicoccaceae bacterium]|nr:MAG: hypothetical protein EA353_14320 [Puniceicoccaceae bacterium]
MAKVPTVKVSAETWDGLRLRFAGSIFYDTELTLLGQNAGMSWPFRGADETPGKYLEYEFEDLLTVPGLAGHKARVKLLIAILEETLAFDDPFSDMVDTIKAETDSDSGPEKLLSRLDIPQKFPSSLIHFGPESKRLLFDERLETIGQIIAYSQRNATQAEFPEDFKSLINYLSHRDEIGISRFVPFRVGKRGLHLAEAIGLVSRDLPDAVQYELLSQAKVPLKPAEDALRENLDQEVFKKAVSEAQSRIAVACGWFFKEEQELREKIGTTEQMERFFVVLNNPHRERVATVLARLYFGVDVESGKRGLFGSIKGIFGQ